MSTNLMTRCRDDAADSSRGSLSTQLVAYCATAARGWAVSVFEERTRNNLVCGIRRRCVQVASREQAETIASAMVSREEVARYVVI